MISKQGLLLKFEQKFRQIGGNLDISTTNVAKPESTTPVVVNNDAVVAAPDVEHHPVTGHVQEKESQNPLSSFNKRNY